MLYCPVWNQKYQRENLKCLYWMNYKKKSNLLVDVQTGYIGTYGGESTPVPIFMIPLRCGLMDQLFGVNI